jgi:hypothetical protein
MNAAFNRCFAIFAGSFVMYLSVKVIDDMRDMF